MVKFPPLSVRTRLTLWYTAALAGLLAVLGAAALILLDRGLRANVDATLESLAQAVAASSQQSSGFGPDVDAALDALLGPSFTRRFFQLLDPSGRPDPRIVPRTRLPLSVDAVRNAEQGRATFETVRLAVTPPVPVRVLTQPVIERGRMVQLVQVALPLDSVDAARRRFLFILLGLAPVALAAVVTDAQPALEALADRAHVALRVAAPEPVMVRGSAPMLFRALFNLGDNAIKYCSDGGAVTIELMRRDGRALITVRDNGPGIDPADASRIFDRFYRSDPARRRGGSGLGLALTKSIVELHGGTIDVESQVGQGSTEVAKTADGKPLLLLVHPVDGNDRFAALAAK